MVVSGNLIEMPNYIYGVKLNDCFNSTFVGNSFYDPVMGTSLNNFFFGSGGNYGNSFILGYSSTTDSDMFSNAGIFGGNQSKL